MKTREQIERELREMWSAIADIPANDPGKAQAWEQAADLERKEWERYNKEKQWEEYSRTPIFFEIQAERFRQIDKWGNGQKLTPIEYCAILGEEFGEVCRAAHDAHFAGQYPDAIEATPGDYSQYRKELIQLATVCVAAIQNLDNAKP